MSVPKHTQWFAWIENWELREPHNNILWKRKQETHTYKRPPSEEIERIKPNRAKPKSIARHIHLFIYELRMRKCSLEMSEASEKKTGQTKKLHKDDWIKFYIYRIHSQIQTVWKRDGARVKRERDKLFMRWLIHWWEVLS